MSFEIAGLMKFGKEKNVLDMYHNGTIYCQPLKYFRKVDDKFRGDILEGAIEVRNFHKEEQLFLKVTPHGKSEPVIELHPEWLQLRGYTNQPLGNIYSMYLLQMADVSNAGGTFTIDPKMADFGSHFVLINQQQQFLDLIAAEIKKLGYSSDINVVEYIDSKRYTGEWKPFYKPLEYTYQKEIRILIHSNLDTPLILKIGSLKEMGFLLESKDLPGITFSFPQ